MPVYRFNLVFGRTGSGKTYFLVRKAIKSLLAGRDIATTVYINYDSIYKLYKRKNYFRKLLKLKIRPLGQIYYFQNLDDFIFMKNCDVFIDEGHTFFFSRDWEKLPTYIKDKVYSHRKDRLNVYVAIQDVNTIDVILRRLADNAIRIRSIFIFTFVSFFEVKDIDKERRKSKWISFYSRKPEIFTCFDSFQRLTDFDKIIENNHLIDKRQILNRRVIY